MDVTTGERQVLSSSLNPSAHGLTWPDSSDSGPQVQLRSGTTVNVDEYDRLYSANEVTTDLESVQYRGGNFVYINSGMKTCSNNYDVDAS